MFWNLIIGIAAFALQLILAPKPQNAKPAALDDFEAPVAEEGIEIPVVFGTDYLSAPNVTWYGDLGIDEIKGARRYGFFGPRQVIGHKYSLGMQMGLCHGPADDLKEIWIGDKLAWDDGTSGGTITIDEGELFGGEEREGGVIGDVDVNMGAPAQAQDTYLADVLGATISAFRGIVTIVLRQVYLGTNTYIKPWQFRLKRIHLTSTGAAQWYDEKAAVPDTPVADTSMDFDNPDPNDEYDDAVASYGTVADEGNGVVDDYRVSVGSSRLSCWKYPTFDEVLWTVAVSPSPQSCAVSANGYVFTTRQGDPEIKVWNLYTGALLATVALASSGAGNTGLACFDDGTTTYCCRFANTWEMIRGSGAAWTQTGDINGHNWITATNAGIVGANYVYAIKGGTLTTYDDSIYRVPRGFISTSLISTVTLSEIVGTIFAVGYHEALNKVVVLDSAGYVHIYNESLTTHIASSPGAEGWTHVAAGYHSISNGMFSNEGICFVAATGGGLRAVVQYDIDANLISITISPTDVDYLNDNSDVTRSMVDAKNHYIVVFGLSGASPPTAWEFPVESTVDALDMNPAHIIRECLTDATWGMGYNATDIDDDAFTAAADTFYAECFGLTLKWATEAPIEDFVQMVQSHVDAYLYTSRTTGKFVLKPIRNDYDIDEIPVLTEDDVVQWDEVSRRQPPDAVTSVTAKYTNRKNRGKQASHTFHNDAQIQQSGGIIGATRNYPGISRGNLAALVAQRDQKSLSAGMISGRITCKRTVESLNPGDPFRLVSDRHNLDGEVMRVAEIKFGGGRSNLITIKFVQDVFHLGAVELIDTAAGDWENPANPPQAVVPRLVWEMPYYEMRVMIGPSDTATLLTTDPDAGILEVAGERPTSDTINATIYVDGVTTSETMGFAPAGLLSADIGALDTTFTITEGSALASIVNGALAVILGSTPATVEIIRVNSRSGNDFTVSRGILDTVPQAHLAGAAVIVYDDFSMSDFEQRTAADTPDVKLVTRTGLGALPLGSAPTDTVTMDSRAIRPLRPANVTVEGFDEGPVDGTGLTEFSVDCVERNRLTEVTAVKAWTDATVTPEASQTIVIEVMDPTNTTVETTHAGLTIADMPFAVPNASFGANPSGWIRVGAARGGYREWQAYAIECFVDDAGDLLTHDSDELTHDGEALFHGD